MSKAIVEEVQSNEIPEKLEFIELVKMIESGKKIDDIKELKITKYLPFVHKQVLVNDYLEAVLKEDDNGMTYVDSLYSRFFKDVYILRDYTNLELSEESILDQYDYLMEKGIIHDIQNNIEYQIFEILDEEEHSRVIIANSIENVLAKSLNKILDKIPAIEGKKIDKWVEKLSKAISTFEPSKYKTIQDILKFNKGESTQ